MGAIPKFSIGLEDDALPKRAFEELSSLSIVIAEAGCNCLLGSVRWEWGQKNWQPKELNGLNGQQKQIIKKIKNRKIKNSKIPEFWAKKRQRQKANKMVPKQR